MAYEYEHIDSNSQQIRLLNLLPGRGEDIVSCLLETVSLRDHPNYETLSYAWGDATNSKDVLVNQCSMAITANLESALRHLRQEDRSLVLWVDAISIQQANPSEKTHQVSMMASIYTKCSGVYLWLGEERASITGNPLFLIQHFAANNHVHDLPGYRYDVTSQAHEFTPTQAMTNVWEDFYHLALSPWWSRVWTVQEAILPPRATVVYGKWRFPWSLLDTAHNNRIRHRWSCCAQADRAFPDQWTNICDNLFTTVNYITQNRRRLPKNRQYPFHRTTFAYGGREASDARDKVIGLLGLSNPQRYSSFIPDYTKSTRQIYIDAFRAMLDETPGDLECLTGSGFNSSAFGLPSWVPNFHRPIDAETRRREMPRRHHYRLYNATIGRTPFVAHNDVQLRLKGLRAGFVARLSDAAPTSSRSTEDLRTLLRQWRSFASSSSSSSSAGDGGSPDDNGNRISSHRDRFWQTVVTDIVYHPQVSNVDNDIWDRYADADADTGDHSAEFEAWLNAPSTTVSAAAAAQPQLLISLRSATFGRAMFTTSSSSSSSSSSSEAGHLGLCPGEAQTGDEIWLLYGSNVPFVLRAVGDGTHRLIGDCYLHGAMDGEMIEGAPQPREERIVTLV